MLACAVNWFIVVKNVLLTYRFELNSVEVLASDSIEFFLNRSGLCCYGIFLIYDDGLLVGGVWSCDDGSIQGWVTSIVVFYQLNALICFFVGYMLFSSSATAMFFIVFLWFISASIFAVLFSCFGDELSLITYRSEISFVARCHTFGQILFPSYIMASPLIQILRNFVAGRMRSKITRSVYTLVGHSLHLWLLEVQGRWACSREISSSRDWSEFHYSWHTMCVIWIKLVWFA